MPTETIYFPVQKTVRFAIYPDGYEGPRILCEIAQEALCECYGASTSAEKLIEVYQANFVEIQSLALKAHAQSPFSPVKLDEAKVKRMKINFSDVD